MSPVVAVCFQYAFSMFSVNTYVRGEGSGKPTNPLPSHALELMLELMQLVPSSYLIPSNQDSCVISRCCSTGTSS